MDAGRQLRAIADIVRVVDRDLWLRGGWAMDFYIGEVTRPHQDIDFFCRRRDAEHIGVVLGGIGFRVVSASGLQRDLETPDGLDVQITSFEEDADGCPTVPAGPFAGTRWPVDLLAAEPGRIGGVSCGIVGPGRRSRSRRCGRGGRRTAWTSRGFGPRSPGAGRIGRAQWVDGTPPRRTDRRGCRADRLLGAPG